MKFSRYNSNRSSRNSKIRIEKPVIRTPEEERLWREVHRYAELIPAEPDPNRDRVREIKDDLRKGRYEITPEIIEETSARLAMRFTRPE